MILMVIFWQMFHLKNKPFSTSIIISDDKYTYNMTAPNGKANTNVPENYSIYKYELKKNK